MYMQQPSQDEFMAWLMARIPQLRQYAGLMQEVGGGVQPLPGGVQPFYGPSGPRPMPSGGVQPLPGGVQPVIGSAPPSGSNWGFGGAAPPTASATPGMPQPNASVPAAHPGPQPVRMPSPVTSPRGPQPVRMPTVVEPPGGYYTADRGQGVQRYPVPGGPITTLPLRGYDRNGPGTAR